MELQILVIQLDPLVPLHRAQAHRDMVRSVSEWAVGDWLGFVHVEVRVRGGGGAREGDGRPCSLGAWGGFEGSWWFVGDGGFFEVGGIWAGAGAEVSNAVEGGSEEVDKEGGG